MQNSNFFLDLFSQQSFGQAQLRDLQVSEQKIRMLIDLIPEILLVKDEKGRWLVANQMALDLYELGDCEYIGKTDADLAKINPKYIESFNYNIKTDELAWRNSSTTTVEKTVEKPDGNKQVWEVMKTPIFDKNGNPHRLIIVSRDITDRKIAETALQLSEEKYRLIANNMKDLIGMLDENGKVRYVSPSFGRVLGYQVIPDGEFDFFSIVHDEDLSYVNETFYKVISQQQDLTAEFRCRHSDGEYIWFEINFACVNGIGGVVDHIMIVARDISERKNYEHHLQSIAYHDYLTGLPNRNMLYSLFSKQLKAASRKNQSLAVLFIDLDRFKTINDTLGHHTGDKLLQAVSKRLTNIIREGDFVFRQGGDEFIIILTDANRAAATKIAERILRVLSEPFRLNNHDVFSTPSIGISLFPDHGETVEKLIQNADTAMYQAKKAGKNTFEFFYSKENQTLIDPLRMEMDLHKAIERHELVLHYQPKVSLKTGKIVGAEALIRWFHSENGLVSPAEFIPIAEETGLILPIGEWAIYTACRQVKEWINKGFSTVISVNISTTQFVQSNFVASIERILGETELEPQCLEIEITESVSADIEHTITTLRGLKKLGVRISIDDFGTGFSSLNYLKQFPVDTLKIDQSFTRELYNNPNDETIVKTIISMAHNLNLTVVAEGIETKEQLMFLQQYFCDEGQGYLISRPVSPQEFESTFDKVETIVEQCGLSLDKNERQWTDEILRMAREELNNTIRLQQGMTLKFKKINNKFIHTLCDGELLYRMGFIPNEVVGKQLFDFLPDDVASEKTKYYERAWEGDERVTYEGEINGIHYLEVFSPIKSGGNVVEVIGSCVDISERRKVEEALRQTEYQYRLILENATDLIRIADKDRKLLFISPSHEKVLGYRTEELEGKSMDEYIHPGDLVSLEKIREFMITTSTARHCQCRMLHKNGYWVSMEIGLTPVFHDDGRLKYIVSVGRPKDM
ncbi:EAL domain-containing protein [Bacillus sp. V5-8f]|uniref:EAL domain-containing protein n=1 Tax=Bacillus sp. V5-8f TaxID=2053044 RepID=UPI0021550A6B|nr:EAL domain-containing protein [Bacillus sp. V5-8f]